MIGAAAWRLLSCTGNEIRLQYRHGLYMVYGLLCLLYVIILRAVGGEARQILLPLLIFMDPTMLGFFFVGGLVLLERSDRTVSALFTTPVSLFQYLVAKVLSLSFLALMAAQVIAVLTVGPDYRPVLLGAAVSLSAAVFTLITCDPS